MSDRKQQPEAGQRWNTKHWQTPWEELVVPVNDPHKATFLITTEQGNINYFVHLRWKGTQPYVPVQGRNSKQILIDGVIIVSSSLSRTSTWHEMLVWAGSACVFLWFLSDKVAVDSAARTVWVPLLRRRRLASLERAEQVEGGCHFLWLLSDDCVSVKEKERVCVCAWLLVLMCVCLHASVLACVGVIL